MWQKLKDKCLWCYKNKPLFFLVILAPFVATLSVFQPELTVGAILFLLLGVIIVYLFDVD